MAIVLRTTKALVSGSTAHLAVLVDGLINALVNDGFGRVVPPGLDTRSAAIATKCNILSKAALDKDWINHGGIHGLDWLNGFDLLVDSILIRSVLRDREVADDSVGTVTVGNS